MATTPSSTTATSMPSLMATRSTKVFVASHLFKPCLGRWSLLHELTLEGDFETFFSHLFPPSEVPVGGRQPLFVPQLPHECPSWRLWRALNCVLHSRWLLYHRFWYDFLLSISKCKFSGPKDSICGIYYCCILGAYGHCSDFRALYPGLYLEIKRYKPHTEPCLSWVVCVLQRGLWEFQVDPKRISKSEGSSSGVNKPNLWLKLQTWNKSKMRAGKSRLVLLKLVGLWVKAVEEVTRWNRYVAFGVILPKLWTISFMGVSTLILLILVVYELFLDEKWPLTQLDVLWASWMVNAHFFFGSPRCW